MKKLRAYRKRIRRRLLRPRLLPVDRVFDAEKIYPWAQAVLETPEAVEMEFDDEARLLQRSRTPTPPTFAAIVKDGLWCTGNNVLLGSPRSLVAESYEAWERDGPCSVFRSPFDAPTCHRPPEKERITGVSTSFQSIRRTFYHSLIDNVSRMALLHHPRFREFDSIEVLVDGSLNRVESYFAPRLLPDNCTIRVVQSGAVYRTETFILLSHVTYQFAGVLHPAYVELFRSRILPSRKPAGKNRILISRQSAQRGRRMTNFDEVVTALGKHGFEVVALENLSIDEQIDLFHDAETVVAAHGAGLANLMYAPEGTRVVELFGTRAVMPHYYFLCKSLGHRHSYLSGTESSINDDFAVNVGALLDQIP